MSEQVDSGRLFPDPNWGGLRVTGCELGVAGYELNEMALSGHRAEFALRA
jgi:hypothetical protein